MKVKEFTTNNCGIEEGWGFQSRGDVVEHIGKKEEKEEHELFFFLKNKVLSA